MSEPKTPNLALNQIDRSSPATTYFDLDRYLDQNWGKVDDFAGEIKEQVDEVTTKADGLKERLDTEQRKSVTLKPGLQVIEAEPASAFRLEGLKGRTLVNLLGRAGNGEKLPELPSIASTLAIDSTTSDLGGTSFKATASGTASVEHYTEMAVLDVTPGACYVLVAVIKPNDKANGRMMVYGALNDAPNDFFPVSNLAVATNQYTPVFLRFNPTTAPKAVVRLQILNSGGDAIYKQDGQSVNCDSIRVYQISPAEYNALGSMTAEQVAAKYPYTEYIAGVTNPYVIRYGTNLLPPFYEWTAGGIPYSITSPYEVVRSATDVLYNGPSLTVKVPVIPGKTYTLNFEITGDLAKAYINWSWNDKEDNRISWTDGNKTTITAIAPSNAVTADVRVTGTAPGTFTIKNPILTLGTEVKPAAPREDAMLALQTELNADPATGANPDTVFERGGQYFKLTKWRKLSIGSDYTYAFFNSYTGGKCVRLIYDIADRAKNMYPIVTKFNGSPVVAGSPSLYVDQYSRGDWNTDASGVLGIGVSSADSGWGDAYTPTDDEIKAYFMGWKMFLGGQGDVSKPYNGESAGKAWCPLDSIYQSGTAATTYSTTLPTSSTTSLTYTRYTPWTPYQLLYQLATPVVEPITSEGQLTFFKGDNQVEVGTGLVVREETKPQLNNSQDSYTINTASGFGDLSTQLSYKVDRFMNVYRNSKLDYQWSDNTYAPFGKVRKAILKDKFDQSAAYSVTYLMLAKYPAANFDGTYSQNEKALLLDTIKSVQENTTRISALESKRAEKDAPPWITPTLLNGWVTFGSTFQTAQYYKDSIGIVHFRGFVKSGSVTSVIFILPEGYRPRGTTIAMPVVSAGDSAGMGISSGTLNIQPNGQVQAAVNVKNGFLTLDGISFLAEQ